MKSMPISLGVTNDIWLLDNLHIVHIQYCSLFQWMWLALFCGHKFRLTLPPSVVRSVSRKKFVIQLINVLIFRIHYCKWHSPKYSVKSEQRANPVPDSVILKHQCAPIFDINLLNITLYNWIILCTLWVLSRVLNSIQLSYTEF